MLLKGVSLFICLTTLPVSVLGQSEIRNLFPEGNYKLQKDRSQGSCPEVKIVHKTLADGKELLMLDPRLVFDLSLLEKAQNEKVPDGCHYQVELKQKENSLTKTTNRFDCPVPSENGVYKEILSKTKEGLQFKSLLNSKSERTCVYNKGGK